jgi:hypothetical protein
MNNDLISRKALKREFGYTDEWYKGRTVCAIIDNAPTVEERPKGEWIEHSTYKGVLICSHCNHGETQAYDTFKFCPNCGADMR